LLETKNEENELLLKEIHHRVKNNLEVVSSLLALQSAGADDINTRNAMKESQNRVRAIGMVHQKLYQGENSETIEMRDYFLNLGENILDTFGAVGKVKLALPMERLELNLETAVPLGLIVNELILNILKYAFPPGQIGNIWIKLEKRINDILHLEVSDDGIGKSGHTDGTGFGSQLISLLTRQLGGIMQEESTDGTRIYFDFKMNKMGQKSICKV
jgi:two-component sensor histidine kinase